MLSAMDLSSSSSSARRVAQAFFAATALGCAASGALASGPTRCYFVGNSLTIAQVMDVNSIALITPNAGDVYSRAYHTLGGIGVAQIRTQWLTNGLASGYSPAPFPQALPTQPYDALVFQPFFDSASTEVGAITAFVTDAAASPGATIYIYATWPARQAADGSLSPAAPLHFAARWAAPAPAPAHQVRYIPGRAHFDQALLATRRSNPGRMVRMIPAGHVLAELDARARAGLVPGLTGAEGCFFDVIHLNLVGQFTVAMTMAGTLIALPPSQAILHPWYAQSISPALDAALRSATTGVLAANAALTGRLSAGACGWADISGPGQSDGPDGELTADDLIVMVNRFTAGEARADIAGPGPSAIPDGEFTADDLLAFITAFTTGC